MRVQINGDSREFDAELPLDELVKKLSLPAERIAIELNQEVIARKKWPATVIKDGDRLEIVHFVGGGSQKKVSSRQKAVSKNGNHVLRFCLFLRRV